MSSISVLLLVLVGGFSLLMFLVTVAAVAFGAYRLIQARRKESTSNVIDLSDGIDEREAALIEQYAAYAKDQLTKQVLAQKEQEAKDLLAKALRK